MTSGWMNGLNALDLAGGWQPDAARAIGESEGSDTAYRKRRAQWTWSGMAASVSAPAILLTPAKCALGVCRTPAVPPPEASPPPCRAGETEVRPALQRHGSGLAAKAPPHERADESRPSAGPPNFKESGNARLADHHARYLPTTSAVTARPSSTKSYPVLMAEYVQTGRMKMVHRDFPLPMHAYATAGSALCQRGRAGGTVRAGGQPDLSARRRSGRRTATWMREVAQVLTPDVMERIRDLVKNDERLDDTMHRRHGNRATGQSEP